jgi:hypothetical protein
VFDAVALGVPSLVSAIPVNREIEAYVTHYFPLDDVAALADAMRAVLREAPPTAGPPGADRPGGRAAHGDGPGDLAGRRAGHGSRPHRARGEAMTATPAPDLPRIAVLVACFNRHRITLPNMAALIAALEAAPCRFDVHLLDDASPDRTGELGHGAHFRADVLALHGERQGRLDEAEQLRAAVEACRRRSRRGTAAVPIIRAIASVSWISPPAPFLVSSVRITSAGGCSGPK